MPLYVPCLTVRQSRSNGLYRRIKLISSIVVACLSSTPCVCIDPSTSTNVKIKEILNQLKAWEEDVYSNKNQSRPFVTVTFAQSIDGYIALSKDSHLFGNMHGRTSSNYPISGGDSLLLTHALRSIHDGILIGGRTLCIDNPRLNNRLWMTEVAQGDSSKQHQPRPIVLDTDLRYIQSLGFSSNLKNPIFCCSQDAFLSLSRKDLPSDVSILPCLCNEDGSLNLADVLAQLLNRFNIRTLMIEGGAATVSSFFRANCVDALVITIAPKFLHKGIAVNYITGVNEQTRFDVVDLVQHAARFIVLGSDAVLVSRYDDAVQTQM